MTEVILELGLDILRRNLQLIDVGRNVFIPNEQF